LAEVSSAGQAQSKLRKLIKAEEILDSELKKAAILQNVDAQQKASVAALEKYRIASQLAMKDATDPKELANNFKKANETEETSLSHSQKLNADALLAKKISREAYNKEDIRLTEESYRKQAELATANYEFLLKLQKEPNSGVSATDTANAYKKQEEADRKLTDFRVANIEKIDTAGGKSAEKSAEYAHKRLAIEKRAIAEEIELLKRVEEAKAEAALSKTMDTLELEREKASSLPTELERIAAIGKVEKEMGEESLKFLQEKLGERTKEYEASNSAVMELRQKLSYLEASLMTKSSEADRERTEESIAIVQEELDTELDIRGDAQLAIIAMEAGTQNQILQLKLNAIRLEKELAAQAVSDLEEGYRAGSVSLENYTAAIERAKDTGALTAEELRSKMLAASDDISFGMSEGFKNAMQSWQSEAELAASMTEALIGKLADFSGVFVDIVSGTKDAKEAFTEFARSVVNMLLQMITQYMILNAVKKAGEFFGGAADGGLIPSGGKYASGGKIRGYSRHPKEDNVHIMATAGEFMQPVKAVQHYGLGFMEAIRNLSFPKNAYSMQFPKSPTPTPIKTGYADGGGISAPPEPTVYKGGDIKLRVVNVLDKGLVTDYMNTVEGVTTLINTIRRNGSSIRTILGA